MKLWIRTDASATIGLGHAKRCLAIAEEARRRRVEVAFVVSHDYEIATRVLQQAGFPVSGVPPETVLWLAQLQEGDVTLCDGYHLTSQIKAATETPGIRVAAFDDLGVELPRVDVLIRPGHTQELLPSPSGSSVLAGPQFAPVSAQFVARRRPRWKTSDSLLVTMGSSDPTRATPNVLATISATKEPRWDVVLLVGPGMQPITLPADPRFSLLEHQEDIASHFDRFDMAVTAGGNTAWELMCMGLPIAIIQTAENQRQIIEAAVGAGAALYGGSADTVHERLPAALLELMDVSRRRDLSSRALELVDGKGPERIVKELLKKNVSDRLSSPAGE